MIEAEGCQDGLAVLSQAAAEGSLLQLSDECQSLALFTLKNGASIQSHYLLIVQY